MNTAAAHSDSPADAERSVAIIDFAMRRYSLIGRILLFAIAFVVGMVMLSVVVGASAAFAGSWFPDASWTARYWIVVVSVLLVVAIPGAPWWIAHRRRFAARTAEALQLPVQQVLPHFLGKKQREPNARRMRMIARELVQRGCVGYTFRVFARQKPWLVTPMRETFDPEPLDEGTSSFDRLSENPAEVDDEPGGEQSLIRRLRRNVRLRGGKFAIAITGFYLLMGVSAGGQKRPVVGR